MVCEHYNDGFCENCKGEVTHTEYFRLCEFGVIPHWLPIINSKKEALLNYHSYDPTIRILAHLKLKDMIL
jgi:hypothetical protein